MDAAVDSNWNIQERIVPGPVTLAPSAKVLASAHKPPEAPPLQPLAFNSLELSVQVPAGDTNTGLLKVGKPLMATETTLSAQWLPV